MIVLEDVKICIYEPRLVMKYETICVPLAKKRKSVFKEVIIVRSCIVILLESNAVQ